MLILDLIYMLIIIIVVLFLLLLVSFFLNFYGSLYIDVPCTIVLLDFICIITFDMFLILKFAVHSDLFCTYVYIFILPLFIWMHLLFFSSFFFLS